MSERVRMGVIGLGTMGRNHARVLSQLPEAELVGTADPTESEATHAGVEQLLSCGIEAAVVAVPAVYHACVALRLAEAGVHVLVEKPVAADSESAQRIVEGFRGLGLVGAVGHVERFNPANIELQRRLDLGELGRAIAISTERVGPYPLRVQDVGVVKDLATHDVDLVQWLGGPIVSLSAELGNRMGGNHEDLMEVIGRLESGAVMRMSVNWLTPTKRRLLTILGERGAMVSDMLSADLTYYANADVPMEWDHLQRLRGVSEGDVVRYALRKREPLAVELEHFCRAVRGDSTAHVVTLEEGARAIASAEWILRAAQPGDSP